MKGCAEIKCQNKMDGTGKEVDVIPSDFTHCFCQSFWNSSKRYIE